MRRLVPLLLGASLVVGCTGDTGCGDILTPLEDPIPSYQFFADGAVMRVSPFGVNFLEENLSRIVGGLAASDCSEVYCPESSGVWASCNAEGKCEGVDPDRAFIAARIPPADNDVDNFLVNEFLLCRDDFNGSNGGDPEDNAEFEDCNVYIRLDDVEIDPSVGNGEVGLTANITVWSSRIRSRILYFVGSQTCDLYMRDASDIDLPVQKTVNTTLSFSAEPNTDRLQIDVAPLDVVLTDEDVHLCNPFDGFLKPLVFGFVEDTINDQIQDFAVTAIEELLSETCADAPCQTDGATCNADDICVFADGSPVPTLLGIEGQLDLNALLGGFAGQATAVDFSMQGDRAEGNGSAIELGFKGAVDGDFSNCVPFVTAPNPTIPAFFPAVIGDDVALAASDKLLNRLIYEVYRSGALCQSISGETIAQLQSGILSSLLVPSLGDITKGSVPLTIDLRPTTLPEIQIGKNIIGPDPANPEQDILIEPLLNLVMTDLDLDVYAEIESALVRIMTLRVDLIVDLSLAIGADGELVLVAGDAGNWVEDAEVINSELLAEDPEAVEDSIPTLLGIALPFLTDSLEQQFAVPSFAGFVINVNDITGSQDIGQTARGDARYAHLGIYADLEYDETQADTLQLETIVDLREVFVPAPHALRDGEKVRVTIDVDTLPALDEAPVVWTRVDGGMWRPPAPRRTVVITDPVLHVEGEHQIEIATARQGAPNTLDPVPVVVDVLVDARDPVITTAADDDTLFVSVTDSLSPAHDLRLEVRRDGGVWEDLALDDEGKADLPFDPSTDLVDLRATDGAGRFATVRLGAVRGAVDGSGIEVVQPAQIDPDHAVVAGSCRHVEGASDTGAWGVFALVALAGGLRRRRR